MEQEKRHYPLERKGHTLVRVNEEVYMWGGYQPSLPFVHDNETKRSMTSVIEIYHLLTGRWEQRPTTGTPPLGVTGYASTSIGNNIYYFGGYCNHDDCYHNSLYRLNVNSLVWTELSPTTPLRGPMMKSHCGMVGVRMDDGRAYLVVVGGWGPHAPASVRQGGARYAGDRLSDLERTNEIYYWSCESNEWISPVATGTWPQPCDSFTLDPVATDRAVLFAGNESNSKVYYCNFRKDSASWTQLPYPSMIAQWPRERADHASVTINSTVAGPHILVVGGRNTSDSWLLEVNRGHWIELFLPKEVTERREHSLCIWSLSQTCHWIIEFGGKKEGLLGALLGNTTVIELICNSKGQWCTGIIPPDEYQHKLRERRRSLCEEGDITEIKIEEDEDSDQSVFKRLSCQALIEDSVAERRKLQQNNNQTVQKQSCCTIS